jgi:hypothetical protein
MMEKFLSCVVVSSSSQAILSIFFIIMTSISKIIEWKSLIISESTLEFQTRIKSFLSGKILTEHSKVFVHEKKNS